MERLGRSLGGELSRLGPAGDADLSAVVEAWPAAVGAENTRRAWPARIGRGGVLHVHTVDAVDLCRLVAVELLGQRCEVRLVSAVLQIAGNLGLLRLCTAAPHWVDPLARMAGAAMGSRSELTVRATTLTGRW